MEAAARVFAGELGKATRTVRFEGQDCLLTPAGACVHLVYLVGALTAVEGNASVGLTARVSDPTGVFLVRATAREPEVLAALAGIAPPAFVAVLGYAEPGRQGPTVRPISIAQVDRAVRDRWLVRVADRTAARLESLAARLRGEGDDILADEAVAAYRVTPATVEELRAMAERALGLVPAADSVRAEGVDLPALLLERVQAAGRDGVEQAELVALGAGKGCAKVEVEEALAGLLEEGECYMPRRGLIRLA
ncbi:MAG TPA: hypothetical protein HA263_03285 [Methanoregulaceae archaeon]|nr:hypothetical protein [Methanoregulaceae archaeon]